MDDRSSENLHFSICILHFSIEFGVFFKTMNWNKGDYSCIKIWKGKPPWLPVRVKEPGSDTRSPRKIASCGAHVVIADLGVSTQPGVAVKMGGREEMESIAADLAEKYKVKTLTVDLDVTNT